VTSSIPLFLILLCSVVVAAKAQVNAPLHNFEVSAAGGFPLSGYATNGFTAGPGWHTGYELRILKYLAPETGFTEIWPVAIDTCLSYRYTCISSRQYLKLFDYGLRGTAPLAGGRVELSLGVGGGYEWNQWKRYNNGALFQYAGKAAFAVTHGGRVRAAFTVRLWRDLGRPTQQWLLTTGGVVVGLGRRP
jgi:hypothetical protein